VSRGVRTIMRVCREDRTYTLRDACPKCGARTIPPLPARYSPEDRYGAYRRKLKQQAGM